MATYYFHLLNDVDVLLDPEGRELDGDKIASAALAEARAIIAADVRDGRVDLDHGIEVQDSSGKMVHRISFEDAVRVIRAPNPA